MERAPRHREAVPQTKEAARSKTVVYYPLLFLVLYVLATSGEYPLRNDFYWSRLPEKQNISETLPGGAELNSEYRPEEEIWVHTIEFSTLDYDFL